MQEISLSCILWLSTAPSTRHASHNLVMDSSRNHSLEAFLAILTKDALADANPGPDWQPPITSKGVRFSNDARMRSKAATGAAGIMRFPGELPKSAQSTIPFP